LKVDHRRQSVVLPEDDFKIIRSNEQKSRGRPTNCRARAPSVGSDETHD
jgi:hypothetical protein